MKMQSVLSKAVTEFLIIIYMNFVLHRLTTQGLDPPVNIMNYFC
jgi:hypothetical protein